MNNREQLNSSSWQIKMAPKKRGELPTAKCFVFQVFCYSKIAVISVQHQPHFLSNLREYYGMGQILVDVLEAL